MLVVVLVGIELVYDSLFILVYFCSATLALVIFSPDSCLYGSCLMSCYAYAMLIMFIIMNAIVLINHPHS